MPRYLIRVELVETYLTPVQYPAMHSQMATLGAKRTTLLDVERKLPPGEYQLDSQLNLQMVTTAVQQALATFTPYRVLVAEIGQMIGVGLEPARPLAASSEYR
jgi:hypothetical protein